MLVLRAKTIISERMLRLTDRTDPKSKTIHAGTVCIDPETKNNLRHGVYSLGFATFGPVLFTHLSSITTIVNSGSQTRELLRSLLFPFALLVAIVFGCGFVIFLLICFIAAHLWQWRRY